MAKYAAKGTKLQVEISSVFTDIPNLGDITLSVGQTDLIPATTHDSANSFKEYLNGFKDSDEFTGVIKYDPANAVHEYIRAAHGGSAINMKLILPDVGNATFAFSALVRNFQVAAPVEGSLDANITFKPTGAITFTA
jgi:predicted secreted protein